MRKLLVSCALAGATAWTQAHDGHGPEGAHWHATDLWGFLLVGVVAAAVLYARRDK